MKKSSRPCSIRGLASSIKQVLTDEWQTSLAISLQLVFPPDAVARRVANNRDGIWKNNPNMSERTSKSHITSRLLTDCVRNGFAEKRRVNGAKNEYRLAQPKSDGESTSTPRLPQ
jgi:hypothetical protein